MNTYWYFQRYAYVNTLWPSDAIRRHRSRPNVGSENGVLSDGIKPLPEPMLTCHDRCPLALIWEQVSQEVPINLIRNMCSEITLVELLVRHLPGANESDDIICLWNCLASRHDCTHTKKKVPHHKAIPSRPGMRFTKPISSILLLSSFVSLSKHTLAIEYHVYIWHVSL